jgi:hypothetical protein
MPYFSSAFLFDGPMQLEAGQPLSLFYRMKVHGGPSVAAALEPDYRDFARSAVGLTDPDDPEGRIDSANTARRGTPGLYHLPPTRREFQVRRYSRSSFARGFSSAGG